MSLLRTVKTFLTPSGSQSSLRPSGFSAAKTERDLFPATRPEVDGEECLHDCSNCTTHLPAKFSIDESDKLYGHVKGWSTHLIVGTGKTDWVRDVTDVKHSVMQAVGKAGVERKNGKIMLSASNLPSGEECSGPGEETGTSDCFLLPAWVVVEKVAPSKVPGLLQEVVDKAVTNETPLGSAPGSIQRNGVGNGHVGSAPTHIRPKDNEPSTLSGQQSHDDHGAVGTTPDAAASTPPVGSHDNNVLEPGRLPSSSFSTRPIPHDYLILMCSHKTRDARCGQSAPLLRKEFERILRPMGLYRDLQDERPGGVGIYFINHVGGHKYSANVMIYRREGRRKAGTDEELDGAPLSKEAVQLIWLARVRPEDCENVVRYTILQGKVVKPERQLRGGFDRERALTSW